MPIEISFDPTIDAIILNGIGKITYGDLLHLAENIIEHPEFRMNINQLFDISGGELDMSTREIERIAKLFMAKSELLGTQRRLAMIVSREVDYGITRQYEVFFDAGPGVEVRSFRSLEEGRQWLRENKE